MKLAVLNCLLSAVSDLSPLEGMPLDNLEFGGTQVSDLSPVKRLPHLALLLFNDCPVSDLSPLKGMPLVHLQLRGTKVTDLSPIKEMPLKVLEIDFKPERDTELLRSIKTLERINGKPVAEFWKEVEQQQAEKNP
jgi:eukaryotic-like serine/threonine-protein kinase